MTPEELPAIRTVVSVDEMALAFLCSGCGKPARRVMKRVTKTSKCVACRKAKSQAYYAMYNRTRRREDREYVREHAAQTYRRHRPRLLLEQREYRLANLERDLWNKARRRASLNNLPFAIAVADIVIPDRCPVLGLDLVVGTNRHTDASPTLDRKDPVLGYVPGNVRVISFRANLLKNNGTADEHRRIADYIEGRP